MGLEMDLFLEACLGVEKKPKRLSIPDPWKGYFSIGIVKPKSRGLYTSTHYKELQGFPLKGGMTIPNMFTLPKTNVDTQNDGLEKVIPFQNGNCWYLC